MLKKPSNPPWAYYWSLWYCCGQHHQHDVDIVTSYFWWYLMGGPCEVVWRGTKIEKGCSSPLLSSFHLLLILIMIPGRWWHLACLWIRGWHLIHSILGSKSYWSVPGDEASGQIGWGRKKNHIERGWCTLITDSNWIYNISTICVMCWVSELPFIHIKSQA